MNAVIRTQKVNKTSRGVRILQDIDLELEKGKIYGFVGPNGSGKSMLFKALTGLTKVDSGTIEVLGEVLGKNVDFPSHTRALIEHPGFLPGLSGFKNLKWLASIQNLIGDAEIREAIRLVGLDPQDRRPVKKYSLGMKQRLGIAQALMERPQILILDEPMNGLDTQGVKDIRNILLGLKEQGVTILLSSHIREDIDVLCDEVFRMDRGVLRPESA
ncbi:MAG: ATP-binding cassette domain-containing protein [Kyrpidia tusciae]|nr:ATP-binding cassette domain-containing protein [Kyrpidia tusciae]MBE3553267.1 ATP-binding cassette domain-containing protein [Kyrpidia tusciae]